MWPSAWGGLRRVLDTLLQKQRHNELEDYYRGLYLNMVDGFVSVQLDGTIIECNPAYSNMLGYSKEELQKLTYHDLTPEKWHAEERQIIETQTLVRGYSQPYVKEYIARNGRVFPVELRTYLIRKQGDEPNTMWAIVRDVTDRVAAESEMSRLRNLLENIVNSMPSVLVAVDAEGRITQWNNQAQTFSGLSPFKVVGAPISQVLSCFRDSLHTIEESIKNREHLTLNRFPIHSDGVSRFYNLEVYPLVANGMEGAVLRMDDVTEQVLMEETMVHTEKMLSVGGLAAGMAHEINNPLAGMVQNAQVIEKRIAPDLAPNRDAAEKFGITMDDVAAYMQERGIPAMLKSIRDSGERAASIVKNMLNFSRKGESQISLVGIHTLLDNTISLAANDYDMKKNYDFKHVKIKRDYDLSITRVPCEGMEIQQVVFNLLKNAAQAMATNPQQAESPSIHLTTRQDSSHAVISVEDNGPGIPQGLQSRIFEPFFTTKRVGEGTGLGLSVAYYIVTENHGGSLQVDSEPGKGAIFTIRLPLEQEPKSSEESQQ